MATRRKTKHRAVTKRKPTRQVASYPNPKILVDGAWLEKHLADQDLCIVDCNVRMTIKPEGGYDIQKGVADWQAAHIPNSCFIDLLEELAAPHPKLKFMMTPQQQFERVMSAHGIGNQHRVVLYSRGANYWATRLFLMFRAMGHDKVHVLNGGWDKWVADKRITTIATPKWPTAQFKAKPRPGQIIGKEDVLAALGRKDTCIINALHPDVHSGVKPQYGRPGHIAGSVNVYAMDLIDPKTKTFLPAAQLRKKLGAVGATKAKRVITYCGGGISATTDSFALLLLGHKNVALYDGSMTEWAPDTSLPMETGT
ncbi:MAG: sulfurtransferase [Rhodospirillaceae bacterium]|nr:sulfurtransferase [Rhodospirillaceae bacterium]